MTSNVRDLIKAEIVGLLAERGTVPAGALAPETSLVDDLGLDSLAFVELTLRLEHRLGLGELPLREWIDRESMSPDDRYKLGSLLAYLEAYVSNIDGRRVATS